MPPIKRAGSAQLAISLKTASSRYLVFFLVGLGISSMVIHRMHPEWVEPARVGVSEVLAPVLDTIARPADAVKEMVGGMREIGSLYEENAKLRQANASLKQWQHVAMSLESENKALRQLMRFVPSNALGYATGRIVGDTTGTYARSVLVGAGSAKGVAKGQAVMNEQGLIGRVMETGANSARVLLVTDINSRLPVMGQDGRVKVIAAGTNGDTLDLMYLPPDAGIKPGEKIITTGDGGVFPPDLLVGVVFEKEDGKLAVRPFVDFSKLEYVSIVNYDLRVQASD
ncbi:MAG: rod shape-determining protein MreC [Alphaproteobacteria bacterium]|nr:rod shape-determining protein MreC [Alphaproteobacteria bacterium]